jgi:RNA recognition motif-containing protein
MKDRESGKSRGFGFVSFDTEEAVEQVLLKLKEHKLLDKWVECKKATPSAKPVTPKSPSHTTHIPKAPTVILILISNSKMLMHCQSTHILSSLNTTCSSQLTLLDPLHHHILTILAIHSLLT